LIYRVLVVDDYEPWRRFICSTLQQTSNWQVVGEVVDGVDAVHAARTLRPDLILVDVGLPTLNGIEATRQILTHDPCCRILFVSEHRSQDIVKAALDSGAGGYIVKSHAVRDLMPAMQAIVDGQSYVSPELTENLQTSTHEGVRRHGS